MSSQVLVDLQAQNQKDTQQKYHHLLILLLILIHICMKKVLPIFCAQNLIPWSSCYQEDVLRQKEKKLEKE